jgi:hypothetical protein
MKSTQNQDNSLSLRNYPLRILLLAVFYILFDFPLEARADPFSATAIGIYISLAVSAASLGLQYLLVPKARPVDKGRMQGDLQLTSIGEDIPIAEIYGGSIGDGLGGIKIGGTIIYASQIRKVVVETSGGGGSRGGKGAPKAPATREYHYYIDLAILVGRGPLRIKKIKANTDLLYQAFQAAPLGDDYEAENGVITGGTIAADNSASSLQKVTLDGGGTVTFDVVGSASDLQREIYVFYKAGADKNVTLAINGTAQNLVLPNSFNQIANVMVVADLADGAGNQITITNQSGATVQIDKIVVGFAEVVGGGGRCILSGVRNPNYRNPRDEYDYLNLVDPNEYDERGCEEYNYQANPNRRGEIEAAIVSNGNIRIYEGNRAQLPDPLLQGYFEAKYGAGSTPAHRNRCYVVFDNFEITKYGSVPNFVFTVEHATVRSLGGMFSERSVRAGLSPDEFDYSLLEAVPLRGYAITQKQAPAREIELLSRVFDTDVFEDSDGVIRGVIPDETLAASIPASELHAIENKSSTDESGDLFKPVETVFRDESTLPYFFDVSFFDALNDSETKNVHSLREVDISDRKENIETALVLTETEAQKFADRELHKIYVEKDALQTATFHKYTYLKPTDLIALEDETGAVSKMRLKAIEGWLPGSLSLKGVSRDAEEFPPRMFAVPQSINNSHEMFQAPAPVIGTFIDSGLFTAETATGFYVAACLTDRSYRWSGAGLYREMQGGYEGADGIPNQATMGRTLTETGGILPALSEPATGWDDVSTVTFDLFNGEVETLTDAEVLEGRNYLVVGAEVIQFGTATRINGFPNRWTVSHLRRKQKNTLSSGHAAGERVVLFSGAWRFIEAPLTEVGVSRDYKFVASGGNLETASKVSFTWNGATQYNDPIFGTIDAGVPVVDIAPTVTLENGYWIIYIKRPTALGYSARVAEVRLRVASSDALIKQADIGDTLIFSIIAQTAACKIDYRWRNGYRLNGSDGWSLWSPALTAGADTIPNDGDVPTTGGGDNGNPGGIDPVRDPGECFTGETLIDTPNGLIRIDKIRSLDTVYSFNPQTFEIEIDTVAATLEHTSPGYFEASFSSGQILKVTGEHPFLTGKNKFAALIDLKPNQTVFIKNGDTLEKLKFTGRVYIKEAGQVYNLRVSKNRTYFAGGFAVHNNKRIPIDQAI